MHKNKYYKKPSLNEENNIKRNKKKINRFVLHVKAAFSGTFSQAEKNILGFFDYLFIYLFIVTSIVFFSLVFGIVITFMWQINP